MNKKNTQSKLCWTDQVLMIYIDEVMISDQLIVFVENFDQKVQLLIVVGWH